MAKIVTVDAPPTRPTQNFESVSASTSQLWAMVRIWAATNARALPITNHRKLEIRSRSAASLPPLPVSTAAV